jgi:hypothetical protein
MWECLQTTRMVNIPDSTINLEQNRGGKCRVVVIQLKL